MNDNPAYGEIGVGEYTVITSNHYSCHYAHFQLDYTVTEYNSCNTVML